MQIIYMQKEKQWTALTDPFRTPYLALNRSDETERSLI